MKTIEIHITFEIDEGNFDQSDINSIEDELLDTIDRYADGFSTTIDVNVD